MNFQITHQGTQVPAVVHVSAIPIISQLPETERALKKINWSAPTASRWNTLEGFNAAFVFEQPGTHTIILEVLDVSGKNRQTYSQTVTIQPNTRKVVHYVKGMSFDNNDTEYVFDTGHYELQQNIPIHGNNVVVRPADPGAFVGLLALGQLGTIFPVYGNNAYITGLTLDTVYDWPQMSSRPYGVRQTSHNTGVVGCTFLRLGDGMQINPHTSGALVAQCKAPLNDQGLRGYIAWNQGDNTVIVHNEVQNSLGAHCFRSGGGSAILLQNNKFWNRDNRQKGGYSGDYGNNCITMHLKEYAWMAHNECHTDQTGDWGGNIELGPLGGNDGVTKPTYLTDRLRYFVCKDNIVDKQIQLDHGCEHGRVTANTCDAIPIEAYDNTYKRGVVDVYIRWNKTRKPVWVPPSAVNVRVLA